MSARRRLRRLITNGALLVGTGALATLVYLKGREWANTRDLLATRESELQQFKEENDDTRPLHLALQPRGFKVCNTLTQPVRIDWVYAAYPRDGKMVIFDSALCTDWKGRTLGDGKTETLALSSAQPGCNWSGDVVFFGMSYTLANGDYRNDAGPFAFAGSDCFTIKGS